MAPRTRLDPVIRLEEHREERSLQALAAANRRLQEAQNLLEQARTQAKEDHRQAGSAGLWELVDSAHVHARHALHDAEKHAHSAQNVQGTSRQAYLSAYARAEAIRRVATTRREEKVLQDDRAAEKEVGDLMLMRRHGRVA